MYETMAGDGLPWPLNTVLPIRERRYRHLVALQEAFPEEFTSSWRPLTWQIPGDKICRQAAMTLAMSTKTENALPASLFLDVLNKQEGMYGRIPDLKKINEARRLSIEK